MKYFEIKNLTLRYQSIAGFRIFCLTGLFIFPFFSYLLRKDDPFLSHIFEMNLANEIILLLFFVSTLKIFSKKIRNQVMKYADEICLIGFSTWIFVFGIQGIGKGLHFPYLVIWVFLIFLWAFLSPSLFYYFSLMSLCASFQWLAFKSTTSWTEDIFIRLGMLFVSIISGGIIVYLNRHLSWRYGGILSQRNDLNQNRLFAEDQEDSQHEVESLIERVVNEGMYGVLIINPLHPEKIRSNPYATELLGYSNPELCDEGLEKVWLSGDFEDSEKFIEEVKKSGKAMLSEAEFRRKDGSQIPVMLTGVLIQHFGVDQVVIAFQDVSHLKSLRRGLLHSAKLASIGQLVAGVAHELNNPLAAIRLHSEIIEGELQDLMPMTVQGLLRDSLTNIDNCVDRMQKIISSLRHFSGGSKVKELHETDLNRMIDQVLQIYGKKIRDKGILVSLNLCESLPRVLIDVHQVEQVIINLVSNAIDAMEKSPVRKIFIETAFLNNEVRCIVQDTGPGIPKANREKIFDPFFTTKNVGQGMGLGLSLSYSIIKEHDGELILDSQPGSGAKFIIILPAVLESKGLSRPLANHEGAA